MLNAVKKNAPLLDAKASKVNIALRAMVIEITFALAVVVASL
jgi:hypothetical protein